MVEVIDERSRVVIFLIAPTFIPGIFHVVVVRAVVFVVLLIIIVVVALVVIVGAAFPIDTVLMSRCCASAASHG